MIIADIRETPMKQSRKEYMLVRLFHSRLLAVDGDML